jgi:trans-2-enoyl-CoA reductase
VDTAQHVLADRTSAHAIGDTIYAIGGSNWNNWLLNGVYTTNVRTGVHETIYTMPWYSYAGASVFYLESFYTFGGGLGSADGSIKQN